MREMSLSDLSNMFLDYAAILATITYTLGGLLFMLPIPVHGVKKWGQNMIKDGIYATFWTAIYDAVLKFANFLMGLLGASWPTYMFTLSTATGTLGAAYTMLAGIIAGAKAIGGLDIPIISGIGKAVGSFQPLIAATQGMGDLLEFYILLYAFSVFIEFTAPLLIALGVMFMSLPFRIGRGIGSMLIAFSLVFYIGLPLLPVFDGLILAALFAGLKLPSIWDFLATAQFLSDPAAATLLTVNGTVQFFQDLVNDVYILVQVGNPIVLLLIEGLIVPILYLTILVGLTVGLAEAIGERTGNVPIVLDIF
mgnify:CR=1 FL=1